MTLQPDAQQTYLSTDLAPRLAAIDIGSNSLRLIVAEVTRSGEYRVLDEEKETTRLAGKLSSTGKLDPEALERALSALRRMKQIAEGYQIRELRVIATCAVREAEDGETLVRRAKDEIGLDVEVISAEQEAQLAFLSVSRNFKLEGKDVAVADIGGGSTELILASGPIIEAVATTPLGAVRLTEMFADADGLIGDDYPKMCGWIDRELRRRLKHAILRPHVLIGSGGTFTSVAEMVMASKRMEGTPLRGYEVTRAEVSHLVDRLRKLPTRARRGVPGLSPDRADIIVAGVTIIDRLMRHFQVNRVQIHDRGVRDGLLLTMIERKPGAPSENPHDQQAAVERFAQNCGTDMEHGKQVARLAGLMLSQLIGRFDLTPADRPLLEAAARLQDVGYLINYDQHHKHSYHLILNSRLPGFKPSELEIVANVARYHRGSEPKKKHDNYRRLSKPDRKRVSKLAALLRIAGGLDRSNSRQVQAVSVLVQKERVLMRVLANENPDVDIWAAQRRAEMFEEVFGLPVTIEWHDPQQASSSGTRRPNGPATEEASPAESASAETDESSEKTAENASADAADRNAAETSDHTSSDREPSGGDSSNADSSDVEDANRNGEVEFEAKDESEAKDDAEPQGDREPAAAAKGKRTKKKSKKGSGRAK
jgi:exopolyphosphatase/guanosine-5'-triphosphate,3'-diphosphate pyrophosphatase